MDLTGKSLGRYHILEQLGEGGMATVYKAYDTRLEAEVAVKVIRTENILPSTLERTLKRFEREAKSLAKLTHPNIIKVIDYGEYEGKPYLVMPYLPGGTLKERLKGKPMPWQETARLLIPIARALDFAHRQGLIHRDVKPSNIIITADGDPMLTDFGIAKILDLEETVDLTGTNAAVGTPEYMAPEQSTSNKVDHRADIYALGVVFYEMVAGRKPYIADTPLAVLIKHASEPLPRPRQFAPNLPQMVENVLLKALAKNPNDRYQSMGEFTAALERLVSGKGPIQDLEGIKARIPWLVYRNPAFWITVGIVGIALIVISVMWLFNRNGGVAKAANVSSTTPSPKEATQILEETSVPESISMPYPTATDIPAGTVLFAENFEAGYANGFKYIYGNWKVAPESNTNKVYEIDNENNSDYAGIDLGSLLWRNFSVDYRVKMLHHTLGAAEVILYFRTNSDGSDGYVEALTPYWKDVKLAKHVHGSSWQSPIVHNFSFNLGQWYHIQVQAAGSRLQIFVDDQLLIDTIDSQFSSGALTFQAGPGAHFLLDDIRVTALSP